MQYKKLLILSILSGLALTGCGGGSSEEPKVTVTDSDNDGVEDSLDAFPNDASETLDTDNDGVGDNADLFPSDSTESMDTDNDGVGDNADAFPEDATETLDTDSDGFGDNIDYAPEDSAVWLESQVKYAGLCTPDSDKVNFEALLNEDCDYLSAYNIFTDLSDPTQGVNGTKSLAYDLSTPLFTDYATKYRFVVMPQDTSATYTENEVLDLPVGTVLVKTFALPSDTSQRGIENESLIETRLLIHRTEGWDALPFVWDSEGKDAKLAKYGKQIANSTVTHDGEEFDFTYVVPAKSDCKQCHQLIDVDSSGNSIDNTSRFAPIGTKARLLNFDYDYSGEVKNQLSKWIENGMLSNAPSDLTSIASVPEFKDANISSILSLPSSELTQYAKGYFDINCAHCHRPEGSASNTGLYLEFWRPFSTEQSRHGVCKQPIAYGGGDLGYDLEPGVAEESIIYARMNSNEAADRMPEIGRSLIHKEGVMLIGEWIGRLNSDPYNLGSCTSD